jgi:hypothetical protein
MYLGEIEELRFFPAGAIYNKEHYMNKEAWDTGSKGLANILRSMHYELSLQLRSPKELQWPEKVTLRWLYNHLEIKHYLAVVGAAMSLLAGGAALERAGFFKAFTLGSSDVGTFGKDISAHDSTQKNATD